MYISYTAYEGFCTSRDKNGVCEVGKRSSKFRSQVTCSPPKGRVLPSEVCSALLFLTSPEAGPRDSATAEMLGNPRPEPLLAPSCATMYKQSS